CVTRYLHSLPTRRSSDLYGAQESMDLIILTTIVMTSVFLVVVIWLSLVLIKFRRKKGQEDYIPKQVEGSQKLETIWTVIPFLILDRKSTRLNSSHVSISY